MMLQCKTLGRGANGRGVLLLFMFVLGGCTSAGTYDAPYALVESGVRSINGREIPVTLTSVDGVSPLDPRRSGPLAPGKHEVVVRFSTIGGPYYEDKAALDLNLAECTRYRIVARYTNLVHVDWTPIVYPDAIVPCQARFRPG